MTSSPGMRSLARRERYVPTMRARRLLWIRQEPWRPCPASRLSSSASQAISRLWQREPENGCPLTNWLEAYFAKRPPPSGTRSSAPSEWDQVDHGGGADADHVPAEMGHVLT